MEATLEHPFFVFGQGWSSCSPERTSQRFGLSCHRLSVGDVCISLTHKDVNSRVAELRALAQTQQSSERSNQISERSSSVGRPGQRATHSFSEHSLLPSTSNRKDTASVSAVPLSLTHKTVEEAPSGDHALSQGSTIHSRKRRWSAPDQISLDSKVDMIDVTTTTVLTSTSQTENTNSSNNNNNNNNNNHASGNSSPSKPSSDVKVKSDLGQA